MNPSPEPAPAAPPPIRRRRWLLWSGGALLLLTLLLGAAFWFLLGTQGGTRFLFTRLGALMPGKLEVAELTGPLRGPLDIRGLVYEREGMSMRIDHVRLEWRPRELLSRRLDIEKLWAEGVRIVPAPSKEPEKEAGPLPDVNLRFNILVRDARVTDLQIGAAGSPPLVIDRIDLATRVAGNHFRIERFTVRSPTVDGQIAGAFQPQGDYPVDLALQWTVRAPGLASPFSGRGSLTGTLERLQVRQTLAAPFAARLDAVLTQPLYRLRFDGRLVFADFNPRLLKADLPDVPASGTAAVRGTVGTFTSTGSVSANVGKIADAGQVAATWSLTRDDSRWRIDRMAITLPGTPTRLDGSGLVTVPAGQPAGFQAALRWSGLRWPLRPPAGTAPDIVSAHGEATLSGHPDAYHADLWADLSRSPAGAVVQGRWTISGDGTGERFRFARLQGSVLSGRVEGTGEVAWKPQVRWNAALRGSGIDPRKLAADFPGNLSFTASTRGSLTTGGPVGTVAVSRVGGVLRGQPVAGAVDLELRGQLYDLRRFDLTWGTASVAAAGRVAPRLDLAWKISAPNLGIAVPQGGGSMLAQGRLSGPPESPRIEVHAKGEGVRIGETSVARASLDTDVDLAPGGAFSVDLRSTDARSGEQRLRELTVVGRGTQASHQLTVAAVSEDGRLDAVFAGKLAGGLSSGPAWSGTIRRLDLRSKPTGDWSLAGPAELAASSAAVRLRGFCWRSGGASLCADGGWAETGAWDVDAKLAGLPLNTFRPYLPEDLQITGDLDGGIRARGNGPALASADVDLRPGAGELRFPGPEGRTVAFPYEQGFVRAVIGEGGAGHATAGLTLTGIGSLSARADVPRLAPGTPWERQPLAGRIDVDLRNLAFVEGFIPDLNRPAGTLAGGYALSGTLGAPRFVGEAKLANGSADLPLLGLKLRQIHLTATGDGSGALAIDAGLRSGPGSLTIKGRAGLPGSEPSGPQTPFRLAIQGKRFQVSDTEQIRAVVSPDLTLTADGKRLSLTGEVRIPQAKVNIEKPSPKGAVKASRDVVFVNAGATPAPNEKLALSARVRVIFGRDVQIAALGLKARPSGSVLVIDEPGRVTRGVGEIEVQEGTFKAYGQDLTIERGRLIFNGPISNPGLDVRAYRKAEDGTTAGIEAKGTAEAPQVTLWSDPPMTQSEALAYLLLGHPLNQAQPEEGNRLANAATSLGLSGGNLLAKKLSARYGLEEARIEGKTLEQASLVVGKYLSPRLYVAYGMGLFQPVNSFRIRYLLNRRVTLQAERGEGLSADALYTIDR